MSLSVFQRRAVTTTLRTDVDRSGLTTEEIQADLGISADQLQHALRMTARADPTHVWLLRDYLHQAVIDAGGEPAEHTVLTEASRSTARQWFPLKQAPRHKFDTGSEEASR